VGVSALHGFAGDVSLSLSGLPASTASFAFSPATVSGGSGTATLDVATSASLPSGSYALTITGTSGATAHSTTVTLDVSGAPDFTLAAAPASASAVPGASASFGVTVGALSGFGGAVSLSLSGLSATQASWSFAPASVAGAGSSTLSVTPAAMLAPGSYPLTVTGTSGTLVHSAAVTLVVVPPPDFTLAATPSSRSVLAGGVASYTLTVGARNGFAGSVALSLSGLTGSQASWSYAPPAISSSGSSTLTVTTAASLAPGTYRLTLTGRSGALSHTATVSLVVQQPPDFALSLSPGTATVSAGGSASFRVSIASKGGFAGAVTFSVTGLPAGASASFSPNPAPTPGATTLTVRTGSGTPRGTYTLRINGQAGTLAHQASASLTVR
jgi:hypothetical protein